MPVCVKIAHMDHATLGQRVAQAREDADMSQGKLAELVGIDRTALNRAEKGERKLTMTEMVAIAEALARPLAFFVNDPVPAVVSRRSDLAQAHDTSRALDSEIQLFASDAKVLLDMGLLFRANRLPAARPPRDHRDAEQLAQAVRDRIGLGSNPIPNLGRACEELGLYTYAAPLGINGPDGACVEVVSGNESIAVAVVNGDARSGRRRMTLAHELGHWVSGDAYDAVGAGDHEKMVNSFAIHFLAPRAGIVQVWNEPRDWTVRDRALAVGAKFRISWSAAIGQLRNLDLIDVGEWRAFSEHEPRYGDYARLQLSWDDEPKCPYLSPAFAAACIQGYVVGRLTTARTIELLRGTMARDDLPERGHRSLNDVKKLFASNGE